MPQQIVKRRSRGFICVNAHPEGCARNVESWAAEAGARGRVAARVLRNVLVVGASTGYGLASRVVAGFGYGAKTLGVFFERAPEGDKTASAGYYNTAAFHRLAERGRDFRGESERGCVRRRGEAGRDGFDSRGDGAD